MVKSENGHQILGKTAKAVSYLPVFGTGSKIAFHRSYFNRGFRYYVRV